MALSHGKTEFTHGCDRVMLCGQAGACKPYLYPPGDTQEVRCVLETLDVAQYPGTVNHYRLLKPEGWEKAVSAQERSSS